MVFDISIFHSLLVMDKHGKSQKVVVIMAAIVSSSQPINAKLMTFKI